jgi:flavorubredoxin
MYKPTKIVDGIYWIGVNDHETELFESMWPLPRGVSYNAYIIRGNKTALVETVKRSFWSTYLQNIDRILSGNPSIDYLILNHMEPDHSGSIRALMNRFPGIQIVGNQKTADFLAGFYGITEGVRVIADGDVLDLGGYKLKFVLTPMVHWPETMMTFEETTQTLFTGDAFGGFGTHEGGMFDDEADITYYIDEIRRYFSNIIGKFSPMVQKAIAKTSGLNVRAIAPAHGLIWRRNPDHIVALYDRWSRHDSEKGAVVVYGSMYSHTQRMAEAVARGLVEAGVEQTRLYDIAHTHTSYVINDLWRFQGVALGCCTYNLGLFPPMDHLLRQLAAKSLKNRMLGIFGSYSWSGGAVKALQAFNEKAKWTLVEPVVEVKMAPVAEQLEQCAQLGRNLGEGLN